MCTVIYIPFSGGAMFSSCRDENPARARALQPGLIESVSGTMLFPADTEKGGTWIGLHEKGHLLVLLNGGFETHQRLEKYRKSRGLIVKDLLDKEDPLKEWNSSDLYEVEPFTLILWQKGKLFELVWDGNIKHFARKNELVPAIWSSSTLYDPLVKQKRKRWFNSWLAGLSHPSTENIYQLLWQHNDEEDGFIMNRQTIRTLSISLVEINSGHGNFHYHDMITGKRYSTTLTLNTKYETAG